jgi:hypothetical protein
MWRQPASGSHTKNRLHPPCRAYSSSCLAGRPGAGGRDGVTSPSSWRLVSSRQTRGRRGSSGRVETPSTSSIRQPQLAVLLGRDAPALLSARAGAGLLQGLADRLVRHRLHHPQRHQPVGQQPQRPALVALGWGAAGQRDQPGLLLAVQPATIGARGRLAVDRGVQPRRDLAQADPGHGGRVDLQRGPDGGVGP